MDLANRKGEPGKGSNYFDQARSFVNQVPSMGISSTRVGEFHLPVVRVALRPRPVATDLARRRVESLTCTRRFVTLFA